METNTKTAIMVEAIINAPIDKVWLFWTNPKHITQWNYASEDWHSPFAENDLRTNGKFKSTMAAKDGRFSFDFEGVYTNVELHKTIEYMLGDGRRVKVLFLKNGYDTKVIETFDPESSNSEDLQRTGWQAILNNFKKHVEAN